MGNSIKNKRRIAEYSEPRGLYPQCPWDKRVVRKEVIAGKMAPCFPGVETGTIELEECPICLLFYPGGLNRMTCCKQSMCTECFLQVKPPPLTTSRAKCPFCKSDRFDAIFTGPLSQEQRRIVERDQQRVLEAQIKMQSEERKRDAERAKQKALKKDTLETEEPKKESKSTTSPSPRSESSPPTLSAQTRTSTSSISSTEVPEPEPEIGGIGMNEHGHVSDYYDGDDIEQLMLEEALRQSLLESKFGTLLPPSSSSPSTNSLSVSLSSTSQTSSASPLSTEAKWRQSHGSTSTSLSTTSSSVLSSEPELISAQPIPVPSVSEELDDGEEDDDEETRQAIALSLASSQASS